MKFVALVFVLITFSFGKMIAIESDTLWTRSIRYSDGIFFLPGDSLILTNSWGRFIKLNARTGEKLNETKLITNDFKSIFYNDGNFALAISLDADEIYILNVNNFTSYRCLSLSKKDSAKYSTIEFIDNDTIAVLIKRSDGRSTIKIYNIKNWKIENEIDLQNRDVCYFRFSPERKYLGIVSLGDFSPPKEYNDKFLLELFNENTSEYLLIDSTKYHEDKFEVISDVRFSSDNKYLIQTMWESKSKIWDLQNHTVFKELDINHALQMKITEDQKYIILADCRLKIAEYASGMIIQEYNDIPCVRFDVSLNDNSIVTYGNEQISMVIPFWKINNIEFENCISLNTVKYINNNLFINISSNSFENYKICVYDFTGNLVTNLITGMTQAGSNHIKKRIQLQTGVYFVQLQIGNNMFFKKFGVVN